MGDNRAFLELMKYFDPNAPKERVLINRSWTVKCPWCGMGYVTYCAVSCCMCCGGTNVIQEEDSQ